MLDLTDVNSVEIAEILEANGHQDLAQTLMKRERARESYRAEETRKQRLAAVDAGARAMEENREVDISDGFTKATAPIEDELVQDYVGVQRADELYAPQPRNSISMKDRATATDLDQPELIRALQHEKPSKQHKTDLYVARIYRRSGGDCQIYEDVKHVWWTADSSVLVIVQYTNPERTAWRNISWLREVIDWYTLTHQEFE